MFQSTRPRGARHRPTSKAHGLHCFNPRARAGRDVIRHSNGADLFSFNPRARAGRDITLLKQCEAVIVSIHAPARGATSVLIFDHHVSIVSIHAPARGATFHFPKHGNQFIGFNPRARAGRDEKRGHCQRLDSCFNPRARAGRDLRRPLLFLRLQRFNPRARAGRDRFDGILCLRRRVSIHAPARGATHPGRQRPSASMFQSTRPRGARLNPLRRLPGQACFNPRARAGRDAHYHGY